MLNEAVLKSYLPRNAARCRMQLRVVNNEAEGRFELKRR
jgi:hypothetical protein